MLNSFNELIKLIIDNCTITDNTIGIHLEASFIRIRYNIVEDNDLGIQLVGSNNTIALNNFIENKKQVIDTTKNNPEMSSAINTWHWEERGNYCSDYSNLDNDGNGIGDTAYVIDENNQDPFPEIEPYKIPRKDPILPDQLPKPIIFFGLVLTISIIAAIMLFAFNKKEKKVTINPIYRSPTMRFQQ